MKFRKQIISTGRICPRQTRLYRGRKVKILRIHGFFRDMWLVEYLEDIDDDLKGYENFLGASSLNK